MFVCRILTLTSDALVDITVVTGRTGLAGVVGDHIPVNGHSVGMGAEVQHLRVVLVGRLFVRDEEDTSNK